MSEWVTEWVNDGLTDGLQELLELVFTLEIISYLKILSFHLQNSERRNAARSCRVVGSDSLAVPMREQSVTGPVWAKLNETMIVSRGWHLISILLDLKPSEEVTGQQLLRCVIDANGCLAFSLDLWDTRRQNLLLDVSLAILEGGKTDFVAD